MEDSAAGTQPWIDDNGVLHGVLPARPRTPQDVSLFADSARRLLGGRTARVILDARHATAIQPEAYMRAIANVESFASAVAIVVSEITPKGLEVFQVQVDALMLPCRLFGDVAAAEEWITSLGSDPAAAD